MRKLRVLQQGVWYEIHTRVNNREPLFQGALARSIFSQVFCEAGRRFVFEVRGLCFEEDGVRFYIKPADGMELPKIMKWVKQTFAVRYTEEMGRTGHFWGDRYGSWVMEGEPPEGAWGAGGGAGSAVRDRPPDNGVRPVGGKRREKSHFPLISPLFATFPPG
jgi:REP element-mobilizing transposase RayT